VLEFPVPEPDRLDLSNDVIYMTNSIGTWFPLLNGQSGFYPKSYLNLLDVMRSFPDQGSVDYLIDIGVTYVLVHERYMTAEKYRSWTSELAASRSVELAATYPEAGAEVRAYRLASRPQHVVESVRP